MQNPAKIISLRLTLSVRVVDLFNSPYLTSFTFNIHRSQEEQSWQDQSKKSNFQIALSI